MYRTPPVERRSVEWYSPPFIVARARVVLGGRIHLDPASCAQAQRVVRAQTWFGKGDGSLTRTWSGATFMNPPFTPAALLTRFVRKLLEEFQSRRVPAAVVLVPNATETPWCQELLEVASACWLKRRVSFWHDHPGKPISGNPRGSLLAYLGPHVNRFVDVCGDLGAITPPSSSWADRRSR